MAAQSHVTHTHKIGPIHCPICNLMARIMRRTMDNFKRDGTEVWSYQCNDGHITEVAGQG